MEALVARIGKPHGLRGEVTVQLHTDVPQERFVPGAVFATEPARGGPTRGAPTRGVATRGVATRGVATRGVLTLRAARLHQGIWLLAFEEAGDRSAAEALRGTRLLLDLDADVRGDENEDGWYSGELVGATVRDVGGAVIGEVTDLVTRPAQDLLEVRLLDGRCGLVPFVQALVPTVHAGAGIDDPHVVLDAPDALFDLG